MNNGLDEWVYNQNCPGYPPSRYNPRTGVIQVLMTFGDHDYVKMIWTYVGGLLL